MTLPRTGPQGKTCPCYSWWTAHHCSWSETSAWCCKGFELSQKCQSHQYPQRIRCCRLRSRAEPTICRSGSRCELFRKSRTGSPGGLHPGASWLPSTSSTEWTGCQTWSLNTILGWPSHVHPSWSGRFVESGLLDSAEAGYSGRCGPLGSDALLRRKTSSGGEADLWLQGCCWCSGASRRAASSVHPHGVGSWVSWFLLWGRSLAAGSWRWSTGTGATGSQRPAERYASSGSGSCSGTCAGATDPQTCCSWAGSPGREHSVPALTGHGLTRRAWGLSFPKPDFRWWNHCFAFALVLSFEKAAAVAGWLPKPRASWCLNPWMQPRTASEISSRVMGAEPQPKKPHLDLPWQCSLCTAQRSWNLPA